MIPLSQIYDETDAFPLSQCESTDETKKKFFSDAGLRYELHKPANIRFDLTYDLSSNKKTIPG